MSLDSRVREIINKNMMSPSKVGIFFLGEEQNFVYSMFLKDDFNLMMISGDFQRSTTTDLYPYASGFLPKVLIFFFFYF